MSEPVIVPLARVEASLAPGDWAWAQDNRAAIEAHWRRLVVEKPALYNGRVLISTEHRIADGVLTSRYRETDYASFLALRDFGFPDRQVRNCFAMAALRASDGAYLLGVMGRHTANAGMVYFPAGTPDSGDVTADGRVDLLGSVGRELAEETGLAASEVTIAEGWTAVLHGPRIALMRDVRSALPADALRAQIVDWLAAQEEPELSDMRIVRRVEDIDPRTMPLFTQAFLRHVLAA
ncbi:NUDIX hydrolase [Chelatococcus sp. SYSU_G07232]|uniref:NUDIX hydrolase n=1 Tax=Chelatococcus albus TaxID=3047466 RepID=A0ABT7AGQ3_9HYPH|nr:NUDIX hydrolase [Chelatococcus sp. SYSU_G07232]MDJ1158549.1 NUDIX hydrolase [Chelatococcus sp. SYSU_G07232]